MKEKLQKYLIIFKKLRVDRSHGIAPHKPILLLSILQNVKNGSISNNQIYITPELISAFKSSWGQLVITNHVCKMALPFFHMRSEVFWKLIPRPDQESVLDIATSISSINVLNAMVDHALIEEDLFLLMQNPETGYALMQFLLDEYFPLSRKYYSVKDYSEHLQEVEDKILNESAEVYRREIKELLQEGNDDEIFLRGGLFKKEIPRIYNNTCCISGYHVDALINVSMIDACHIRPFSSSFDDTISNGITLCPNLHRAFDRGLITIDTNYNVIISKLFIEHDHPFSIRQFAGKKILLPQQEKYWPNLDNLEWHNLFFEGKQKS